MSELVVYEKLFELMKQNEITYRQLREGSGISGSTLTNLRENKGVSTEAIGKICRFFDCTPNDVMEILPYGMTLKKYKKQKQIEALEKQIEELKHESEEALLYY